SDPQYSHGYLVPLFALYLLWQRRGQVTSADLRPSCWGLPLVMGGAALHLLGAYLYFDWICGASLLPVLAGLAVCFGGRKALAWSGPAIAFLAFMLPLPYRLETALSHPLQRVATVASTYALQTLGFPAVAEGNVIVMN